MQQRGTAQQVDVLLAQFGGELFAPRQRAGEQAHVLLHAHQMATVRAVAQVAEGGQGFQGGVLDGL
ncbi:hypothetical protein D3C80_1387210 [compost metagenome]